MNSARPCVYPFLLFSGRSLFVDNGEKDTIATVNKLTHVALEAFCDQRATTRELKQTGNHVLQPLFPFVRVFCGDTICQKNICFIDVAYSVFIDANGITEWFVRFRWVYRLAALRRSGYMASSRSHVSSRL